MRIRKVGISSKSFAFEHSQQAPPGLRPHHCPSAWNECQESLHLLSASTASEHPGTDVAWPFGCCLELPVVAAEHDADGEFFSDGDEAEDSAERGDMIDHLDSLLQMPRADDLEEASHLPSS